MPFYLTVVPKLCLGAQVSEALLPDILPNPGKQSLPDCIPKRSLGTRTTRVNENKIQLPP